MFARPSAFLVARVAPLCVGVVLLAGCGGGGGSDTTPVPPTPPTPLPTSVTITAPAKVQSASNVAFAPSFSGSSGLTFKWDFGDGSAASVDAAPTHQFAKPGDFQVGLTVSDASGASRNASFDITVNNQANVRGLVCSAADDAGWCWSRTMQGNGDLFNDVFFLDGQVGWAGSDTGALYKTADGGKTWASKFRLAGERFQQVAFADANRGWALTSSGKLYTSANGGDAWTLQLDRSAELTSRSITLSLTVTDAQRVALKGTNVSSRLTADGGQSWRTVTEPILAITKAGVVWGDTRRSVDYGQSFTPYGPVSLQGVESLGDVSAVSADVAVRQVLFHGLISNHYIYNSAIAVTTDGGASWVRRDIATDGPRFGLAFPSPTNAVPASIYAATADKLWALDGTRVARSVDGGRTWAWLARGPWPAFTTWFGEPLLSAGATDADNPDGFSMVVAEGSNGDGGKSVLRTSDGGTTWKRYAPSGAAPQTAVAAFKRLGPSSLLWQSGSKSLFRTDDDGAHWALLAGTALASSPVGAIAFWDDKQGLAVQKNGNVLSTADGGQTWGVVSASNSYNEPALQLFDTAAWLLRPSAGGVNTLNVSTDRGKTWTNQKAALGPDNPAAMNFFDAKHGIVATDQLQVLSTSDGGATWRQLSTLSGSSGTMPAGAMSFSSPTVGLLRSRYSLYVTGDGGTTWKLTPLPTGVELADARLVDGLHGWAVGAKTDVFPYTTGALYETGDGGLTWAVKALPAGTPPLNAIHFQTARLGWIVGNAGTVLMTRDGGATWTRQDVGPTTRDFAAVYFNTPKNGWLGGSLGEFMATGTGGY